jgi:MFS family permease
MIRKPEPIAGGTVATADFRRLWAGTTVSVLGSQMTTVALPLTAVTYLHARPAAMGVLTAAGLLPYLLFGLPAGAWVDRRRRRPVVIACDLGRAGLLALVPVLMLLDRLSVTGLIAIAFGIGVLTMVHELAFPALLPGLLPPDRLVEANSRLRASLSVADVAGPSLAGVLVQALTAPVVLLADTVSYLLSAVAVRSVRRPEAAPPARRGDTRTADDVRTGLRITFGTPELRAGALAAASYNLFHSGIVAVLVLYVVGSLGVSPMGYALAVATGGAGALVGSLVTVPLARRIGTGRTIVASAVVSCTSLLLLPLIGDASRAVPLLALALFGNGVGLTGWNVQIVAVQQAGVPAFLLGRMNASYLLLSFGAGALGALGGGLLGNAAGLRTTLLVGALGVSLAWLWLLFSPLRHITAPRPLVTGEEDVAENDEGLCAASR